MLKYFVAKNDEILHLKKQRWKSIWSDKMQMSKNANDNWVRMKQISVLTFYSQQPAQKWRLFLFCLAQVTKHKNKDNSNALWFCHVTKHWFIIPLIESSWRKVMLKYDLFLERQNSKMCCWDDNLENYFVTQVTHYNF